MFRKSVRSWLSECLQRKNEYSIFVQAKILVLIRRVCAR